ncbi:hypothetical protein [Actinokineospora sp. HUAS TT18]|uniref:hypothetical protein n=1 Tax=Actinokineospora sp. HUAS TT18 TaxID=3447451 RepID=UPI003F523872
MGDVMTGEEQVVRTVKPGRRARVALGLIAALSVALGAAGLVAAARIKSPSQALAEAAPPAAGPVTAPVEHRVMQDTVVLRGTVGAERAVRVRAPGAADGSRALVTRVQVAVGDAVSAGTVIAEVSGRPVIVLAGAVPAYRDLVPGSEGADVTQLQHALRAVGHGIGRDKEGVYGQGTKLAVAALYRAVGYSPSGTSPDDDQQLLVAERALRDAKRALTTAAEAPNDGDARQRVADAQQDLDTLKAKTGATVPAGEVAFVPTLPATVATMSATAGSAPPEVLCTLAGGDLVVRAVLDAEQARQVRPGHAVDITSEVLGAHARGAVAAIAPRTNPAERESAGSEENPQGADALAAEPEHPGAELELIVRAATPLDAKLANQNVRLVVVAAATESAVLVVPVAAVSSRADGQAQLIRADEDRREHRVAVTAGISGGGYIEVTPVDGALAAGDRVVIGR